MKDLDKNKRIQIIHLIVILITFSSLIIVSTGIVGTYNRIITILCIVLVALLLIYAYAMDAWRLLGQKLKAIVFEWRDHFLTTAVKLFKQKIEQLKISNSDTSIDLLSPVADIERHRIYVEQLKKSIDSPDAKNIALTGAYGSGKSSIIKSFLSLYPKYRYINVSLASFVEVNTKNRKSTKGGSEENLDIDPNFEEQLEYSILQQLFYQVKISRIPSSRFGRIERSSVLSRSLQTIVCFILLIAVAILFYDDLLTDHIGVSEDILKNSWVHWGAVTLFAISFLYIIFKFVVTLSRISLKTLKVSEATLQLEDKKNVSIMNRYTDEIMYLFQEMKYEIVIFEDIDRFDGTHIFTKLRELNLILNQSEEIKHKVVFIYALRDDIFTSAEQRTKFFDYIIPVIPYVNVSNSADLFRRKFKELDIPEDILPVDYITDISAFVDDMRVLTNVVNEFKLYRRHLDENLDLKKLLAIILYKNIYPTDFAKLHHNEGVTYSVFASKPELKSLRKNEIEDNIRQINSRIEELDNEHLQRLEELRKLVAYAFLQKAYNPSFRFYDKNLTKEIPVRELSSESSVDLIVRGMAIGYNPNGYSYNNKVEVTIDDLRSTLGKDFDYEARKAIIVDKSKAQMRRLQQERRKCSEQLSLLSKNSLLELSQSGVDIFSKIAPSLLEGKDFKVLRYMLEHGYIDEEYFLYISLFQEGMLSPGDQRFLMNLKFGEKMSVDYKLQEVKSLVINLSEPDYDRPGIVNFDLMDYLFANRDDNSSKCEAIINQIISGQEYGLDTVFDYLREGKQQKAFIKYLIRLWPSLWNDIMVDAKHDDKVRDNLLCIAFDVSTLAELKEFCVESLVSYVNKKADYLSLFSKLELERAKQVIDLLDPSLCHIGSNDNIELIKYIVDNDYYELNHDNVLFILDRFGNNDCSKYVNSIYTSVCISNIDSLKDYVEQEILYFVRNLVLTTDNVEELEKPILSLLNNEDLPSDVKRQLIEHNKTKVEAIEEIVDNELKGLMYVNNRVVFSIDNVRLYYQAFGLDDTLCEYLNTNVSQIASCVDDDYVLDDSDILMLREFLVSDKIDVKVQCAILQNEFLFDSHPEDWTELRTDVLKFALSENMISYSIDLAKSLRVKHPSILTCFASKYVDHIVGSINELDYPLSSIQKIISLPEFFLYEDLMMQSVDERKILSASEAEFYVNYVIANEQFQFKSAVFDYAIERSMDYTLKANAIYSVLSRRLVEPKDLVKYTQSVNAGFADITNIGQKMKLPNQDPYIKIMNFLYEMSVIGKPKDHGDEIVALVRTPRKK